MTILILNKIREGFIIPALSTSMEERILPRLYEKYAHVVSAVVLEQMCETAGRMSVLKKAYINNGHELGLALKKTGGF